MKIDLSSLISGSDISDLTRLEAQKALESLAQEIAEHDYNYFNLSSPTISDESYDALRRINALIENKFPDLRRIDSPTQRIGSTPSSEFLKVKHRAPMLSLDNAFNHSDIINFVRKINRFLKVEENNFIEMVAEPKIDGLSATLHYQEGKFVLGATRGDGEEGENITPNLRTIRDIPLLLQGSDIPSNLVQGSDIPSNLEVRGEVYMNTFDFKKLNTQRTQNAEQIFANPRNAASGSLRQLNSSITAQRPLRFFAYGYNIVSNTFDESQMDSLNSLKKWGFSVNPLIELCQSADELHNYFKKIEHMRPSLPYEIDGIVYKINNLNLQKRLGNVGRFPRHSIARKFPAERVESVIESVHWQVGRTGVITPVAILKPVLVGGVVVSRATLHNKDEIEKKDIHINDHVIMQRAGDVIPQITEVIQEKRSSQSQKIALPLHCPSCNTLITTKKEQVAIKCTNHHRCPSQIMQQIKHFVSRDALNIDGLGGKHIENFFEQNIIKNIVDIFTLEERNSSFSLPIQKRTGWGKLSAQNLFNAIRNSKSVTLDRFIYALGVPQIGQLTAKLLARYYKTLNNFLQLSVNELLEIEGIGSSMAEDIFLYINTPQQREIINQLRTFITVKDFINNQKDNLPLFDQIIVFTGTLKSVSRSEAKFLAEKLGAKVSSSISSKTNFVVAGFDAGSKLKEAQKLGTKIINEEEWIELTKLK